jgi:hypothetical protein
MDTDCMDTIAKQVQQQQVSEQQQARHAYS